MNIFHGDNRLASRQAFIEIKSQCRKEGFQVNDLNGSTLIYSDLIKATESISLLGTINAVFIEDFFSRKTSNEKKLITEYLTNHLENPIYILETKDQSLQLKSFSEKVVKKFSLPKHLYSFLDTFSLDGLELALLSSAPEQILVLLSTHVHNLIMVKENCSDLPSWQKSKLIAQAGGYSLKHLISFNKLLLEIDFKQKNSLLPYPLSTALELWTTSLPRN